VTEIDETMIRPSFGRKHYSSARERFFRPALINFFAREFPSLFGPVMREKLADELIGLFEELNPQAQRLKPGQVLWNALDKHTRGDSDNRRYVPVVLSLVTEEDVEELTNDVPCAQVSRNAIARIIREAYEQGGILSMRDVALLTLRRPTAASYMRITYEKQNDCLLPHTGRLHDMGSCITHKDTIIRKVVVEKKDPADVARECNHTQRAVDSYLRDYHRVKTLQQEGKDIDFIHLVTGLSRQLIKQYLDIIEQESKECLQRQMA